MALMDREGTPGIFYESEEWCVKIAWETLCNVTSHDLGFALKTGRIPAGDVHIAVKKRIEEWRN